MQTETLDDQTLTELHDLLKKARASLAKQTTGEDSELFRDFFRHELSESMRHLCFEKHLLYWVNYHWLLHQKRANNQSDQSAEMRHAFGIVFIQLIERIGIESRASHAPLSQLMQRLLQEKLEFTEGLIEAGERSDEMYQRLQYQHEKDKRIFERALRDLSDGDDNDGDDAEETIAS